MHNDPQPLSVQRSGEVIEPPPPDAQLLVESDMPTGHCSYCTCACTPNDMLTLGWFVCSACFPRLLAEYDLVSALIQEGGARCCSSRHAGAGRHKAHPLENFCQVFVREANRGNKTRFLYEGS
jgi:hypothetical protein